MFVCVQMYMYVCILAKLQEFWPGPKQLAELHFLYFISRWWLSVAHLHSHSHSHSTHIHIHIHRLDPFRLYLIVDRTLSLRPRWAPKINDVIFALGSSHDTSSHEHFT